MTISVSDLHKFLVGIREEPATCHGENQSIDGVATHETATVSQLAFVTTTERAAECWAGVLMMPHGEAQDSPVDGASIIYVLNPRRAMAHVIAEFFSGQPYTFDIHKSVRIDTRWHVSVLCRQGFGYVKEPDGSYFRFPHIGGVVIEADVEIDAFSNIDRGTIGDTIIRRGVKIDKHVHVAHNVEIGEDTLVVAHASIGGSVKIGKGCYIGHGAIIKNGLTIGDGADIGQAANVLKDVPPGETWIGNPARRMER